MRPIALVLVLAWAPVASACTFCGGGGVVSALTLREHFANSKFVARGKLKNPKFDPNGSGGTTEFQIETTFKNDPAFANKPLLTLPRYLPLIGNTPTDYLLFCAVTDGKPDPLHGVPATAALADYLTAQAKLDPKDTTARLTFAFRHLDSGDTVVSGDAYLEFAKAPDTEILKAKAALNPAKLRILLADPKTPSDRLGVFALLVGLCGDATDIKRLAELLDLDPLPDRVRDNLGGLLAALTLLDSQAGWKRIEAILQSTAKPVDQKLSAIGTVRFFQSTRPAETKTAILKCYKALLNDPTIADIAIDDLRRWAWWDITTDILALFGKPTHAAPVLKRGIVRYALRCPEESAKTFVDTVRTADPKLVANVEETLKLFDPVKP